MSFEIERKFLVRTELLPEPEDGVRIAQAYLRIPPGPTVRIRQYGDKAYLTIKGETTGISRPEFEYPIPPEDIRPLFQLAVTPPVIKVRKTVVADGKKWEIDFFEGDNQGLILAEIELRSENEQFILPDWVGQEVSGDPKYYNSQLAVKPFLTW
jgi:adenylate cyclase